MARAVGDQVPAHVVAQQEQVAEDVEDLVRAGSLPKRR